MKKVEERLAIFGGKKVCSSKESKWPVYSIAEERSLIDVLKSKQWGGMPEERYIEKFEKMFSIYHEKRFVACVSSGTVALVIALQALGIGAGDEVIVPSMSFIATATAVSMVNAVPVFIDIKEDTQCIDVSLLDIAFSDRTKAVIPVHVAGHPCEMDSIMLWAEKNNVYVIEDCAQAHGAKWKNKLVGTWGHVGCFSFAQTKNMASGEGGAIITPDYQVYERVRLIRNHGRISGTSYYHKCLGSNYRITEFQAAVLCCQLERLDEQLYKKSQFVKKLYKELIEKKIPWIRMLIADKSVTRHGNYSVSLFYDSSKFYNIKKETIVKAMCAEGLAIAAAQSYSIHNNPIFQAGNEEYCENIKFPTPISDTLYKKLMYIGQSVNSAIMLDENRTEDVSDTLEKISNNWTVLITQ